MFIPIKTTNKEIVKCLLICKVMQLPFCILVAAIFSFVKCF
jgi:hypothetical protein